MKIVELLLGFWLKVLFWVMVQTAKLAGATIGFIFSAIWSWWQARRARPVYHHKPFPHRHSRRRYARR